MKYYKSYTCQAPLSNISRETCKEMLQNDRNVNEIASCNAVSRKHLYKQMQKFEDNIDGMFQAQNNNNDVLFYLPVTPDWLAGFVLSLMFDCKGSFRGIQRAAQSLLDLNLSHDFINETCRKAKEKAAELNLKYNLKPVVYAALDELFHLNKPVLGGIDLKSLFCFNLKKEDDRQGNTWASNLAECQAMGLSPEQVIADAGSGIASAVKEILKSSELKRDLFHNIMELTELRRFMYNKTQSTATAVKVLVKRMNNPRNRGKAEELQSLLFETEENNKLYNHLYKTISILVEWMRFDILQKPGYSPEIRRELYDFIVEELHELELLHPHRIKALRRGLQKNKEQILGFLNVLDDKFDAIAAEFNCSKQVVWKICHMLKYNPNSKKYLRNKLCMLLRLGADYLGLEEAVKDIIDSTPTSSSLIENFNSRLSGYFFLRKHIDNKFLALLQFYLNHKEFPRSEQTFRKGKSPVNVLTGEDHPHWLEMLDHALFKRAA